jgi:hypothetical protein
MRKSGVCTYFNFSIHFISFTITRLLWRAIVDGNQHFETDLNIGSNFISLDNFIAPQRADLCHVILANISLRLWIVCLFQFAKEYDTVKPDRWYRKSGTFISAGVMTTGTSASFPFTLQRITGRFGRLPRHCKNLKSTDRLNTFFLSMESTARNDLKIA